MGLADPIDPFNGQPNLNQTACAVILYTETSIYPSKKAAADFLRVRGL